MTLINYTAVWLLTATMLLPVFATDNILTEAEQAAGWQLLFNGKDLTQWRNFQKPDLNDKWVIEDDSIKLTGAGGGDILTKATYTNFELKLDWKISEAGNSGIFVLVGEQGQYIYSHAPEIQLLDNERHPDNKIDSHLSGSLYDLIASPSSSHRIAGEWNSITIRLNGSRLQVWQNEVQTVDILIGSDRWQQLVANSKFATWQGFAAATTGHIGLQDHGDVVWFKNIKIKELH